MDSHLATYSYVKLTFLAVILLFSVTFCYIALVLTLSSLAHPWYVGTDPDVDPFL